MPLGLCHCILSLEELCVVRYVIFTASISQVSLTASKCFFKHQVYQVDWETHFSSRESSNISKVACPHDLWLIAMQNGCRNSGLKWCDLSSSVPQCWISFSYTLAQICPQGFVSQACLVLACLKDKTICCHLAIKLNCCEYTSVNSLILFKEVKYLKWRAYLSTMTRPETSPSDLLCPISFHLLDSNCVPLGFWYSLRFQSNKNNLFQP